MSVYMVDLLMAIGVTACVALVVIALAHLYR
jgi:hypothetical protein